MHMEKLMKEIVKFVEERAWKKYHNPKDLAISISIESAELLEHFQWVAPDFDDIKGRKEIIDEIADIMIYCLLFFHYMGVKPEEAIIKKINKNKEKYPVS